jgi:hypothetical protein
MTVRILDMSTTACGSIREVTPSLGRRRREPTVRRDKGKRFLVKDCPKDGEWRQLKISAELPEEHATRRGLVLAPHP